MQILVFFPDQTGWSINEQNRVLVEFRVILKRLGTPLVGLVKFI